MSEKSKRMNKNERLIKKKADWTNESFNSWGKSSSFTLEEVVTFHSSRWVQTVENMMLNLKCCSSRLHLHVIIKVFLTSLPHCALGSRRNWRILKRKRKGRSTQKKRRIFGKSPPKHSKLRILINQSERCTQAHWSQSVSLAPSAQVMWLISTGALLKNSSSV